MGDTNNNNNADTNDMEEEMDGIHWDDGSVSLWQCKTPSHVTVLRRSSH